MSLYPTKTRLTLLRAVEADCVLELPDEDGSTHTWDTTGAEEGEPARKVDARVEEMMRAGWVDLVGGSPTWYLTPAGKAILREAR